jgi:hypothetical protein
MRGLCRLGGALSSFRTLHFRLDGAFSRAGAVHVSSIDRTVEVSGGVASGARGTYDFGESPLVLRKNEVTVRASVPVFGTKDAAGGPEHFSCEGWLPGCGKSAPTPSGAATSRRWPHPSGSPFPASRVSD